MQRGGHVSHMEVSRKIGSNQRTDPGTKFSFAHLYELTKFFGRNNRF